MAQKYVNIKLDDVLHTQSKVISVIKNMTMQDFIEQAISEMVEKDKKSIKKLA